MEFKLYNYIMMPSMILSWIFGLALIGNIGFDQLNNLWLIFKANIYSNFNSLSFFFRSMFEQIQNRR